MRLSTSINMVGTNTYNLEGYKTRVKLLKEVGFDVQDISFMPYMKEDYILSNDNWREQVEELAQWASDLGVEFSQSHLPFIGSSKMEKFYKDDQEIEKFKEFTSRGYIADGILGVKWTVLHTFTRKEDNYSTDCSAKFNYDFFAPLVEVGINNNVGTAFENMLRRGNSVYRRRYCEHYDELIDFVNMFDKKYVGICWDTGHANVMGLNQKIALSKIGSLLKATHINDNKGIDDDHVVPFMGTVNWDDVVGTLREIGYNGDFTFEIPPMSCNMPFVLQKDMVKTCYEVGKYLLK